MKGTASSPPPRVSVPSKDRPVDEGISKKKPQNSLPKHGSFPSAQAASRQLRSSLTGPCCEASVRKAAAPRASRAMLTFVGLQGTGCSAAGLEKQTPIPLHGRFLWSRGSPSCDKPELCCSAVPVLSAEPGRAHPASSEHCTRWVYTPPGCTVSSFWAQSL